jgi:hypothetical protein
MMSRDNFYLFRQRIKFNFTIFGDKPQKLNLVFTSMVTDALKDFEK